MVYLKRYLVTGGAGYLGSHIVELLVERGHSVVVLDAFYYGDAGIQYWKNHPNVRIEKGDICNIRDLLKAMKDVDCVIALAALVGDPICKLDEKETLISNFESTKLLLEMSKLMGVKRIVFASSCSVYGSNPDLLLNEGSWVNPVSLYAQTRLMSEKVLLESDTEVEIVILRLATLFGRSPRKRLDLVVNTMTAKALLEKKIQVFGKDQVRPLLNVRDAAHAFIAASEAGAQWVNRQVFNTGANQQNYTIEQIARAVQTVFPDVSIEINDIVDPRDYRVDFSKAEKLLQFKTRHTLTESIAELREDFSKPGFNASDDIYYNVNYFYKTQLRQNREQPR